MDRYRYPPPFRFRKAGTHPLPVLPRRGGRLQEPDGIQRSAEPRGKGREKLATVIREHLGKDPRNGTQAFIFYSKDYRTVKIYHRDYCGIEIYTKWFENGRMLKSEFRTIARTHTVTRSQLTLLLAGAVQATLKIE